MNVLKNYDTDQMFPTFGFGAKLPGGRESNDQTSCSHCFALNGNIFEPECSGVEGVLDAYYNAVGKVKLWGNTQFHHFLDQVNCFVDRHQQTSSQYKQTYTICLIITDGVINDMNETID